MSTPLWFDPRAQLASLRDQAAVWHQLQRHLTACCTCSCHDGLGHCEDCCQDVLCRDCLDYAMGA